MPESDQHDSPTLDYSGTPRRRRWRVLLVCLALPLLAIALGIWLILPSLNRTRELSNRDLAPSRLHAIAMYILLYTNDHNGEYPDSFATILINGQDEDITSDEFVSPLSNDVAAVGPTTQAVATNLSQPGHCSYVYLGRGLTVTTAPAKAVVAYEQLSDYPGGGTNVLFADGSQKFVDAKSAAAIVAKAAAGKYPVTMPTSP
jgi:prepilin-type processing-associated H-X9-DG protein